MFLFLFFSVLLLRSFFRLKELFQVKNGLTTSLLVFFLKILKIWVGKLQVLDLKLRNYGDVTEQLGDKMPHPNRTNLVLSGLIKRWLAQHH